jgi:hypothetical protein
MRALVTSDMVNKHIMLLSVPLSKNRLLKIKYLKYKKYLKY